MIDRVFGDGRCLVGAHVQKHTAAAKHQAEQAAHEGHGGYALLLVGVTSPQRIAELIPLEKFLDPC